MNEWKEYKIGELCSKVASGGTPLTSKKEYYEGGTIPWLKTTEVHKEIIRHTDTFITEEGLKNSSAKLIPANSIVIAMYGDGGTAGKAALTKIPITTNQACCNLSIDEKKADYAFIFYYLKINYDNLVSLKTGGSQQNLNALTIKNFPIIVPSLHVQKRISNILSTYDELIETNNQRIKILEETAQQLYKEWFVRMRFPNYKKVKFVKGVPEGWRTIAISEVVDFQMGQSPQSEFYNEEGIGLPFHQGVGTYGERFPDHKIHCSVNGRIANKGDILFSVRAPVGRLNIADRTLIIGRGLAALKHNKGLNNYLFYLLQNEFSKEDIIGNGSIFNSVGKDELKNFKIFDIGELAKKFNSIVEPFDNQISVLLQQNTQLCQIRDRLLPRLVSGKLRIKGEEIS
jgi:type I restriction enzyme, S subunit